MTYCVGLLLTAGMVLLSDTRTNAGLDNIATYRKSFVFEDPGERVVAILTAGSLSVTQTTIARLQEAMRGDPGADPEENILTAPTMLRVAEIVGRVLARVRADISEKLAAMKQSASASLIVAGQRKGGGMRPDTSLEDARKAVLLSMDSTLKSNLSVGMPLDLLTIAEGAYGVTEKRRIEANDPAFREMSEAWSLALREAFRKIAI
jgi:putative proteasome-type protease